MSWLKVRHQGVLSTVSDVMMPRTSRIRLFHLPREISDKFRMRPTQCDGDRTRTEMFVPKTPEYLTFI